MKLGRCKSACVAFSIEMICICLITNLLFGPNIVNSQEWTKLKQATANAKWSHPELTDENYLEWSEFVWPTSEELAWQKVRWHIELADAQEEARRFQRPILLWTMNGHPCGET